MKTSKHIVPAAAQSAVAIIPKPTRTEVVAALLMVARKEWEAARKANADAASMAREAAFSAMGEYITKNAAALAKSMKSMSVYDDVTFCLSAKKKSLPSGLRKLLDAYRTTADACSTRDFPEERVKKRIVDKLNADPERVAALSLSPEVAALWTHIKK